LNFKSKTSYGNLNIIPMGKIDFGVTSFSEYTDFGTSTTSSDIYESHTFKSGGITTGFVFDSLFLMNEGTTRPNGSFEYIADFTPDTDYQYKTTGGSTSISNNVEKHSLHNLKGNIGIETIFSDHTLSISYERLQSLNESAHYDNLFFKLGYLPKKNTELAINFSPLQNYQTNINYKKNINGFDIKFGSNYSLMSKIPVYGVNFEIGATY